MENEFPPNSHSKREERPERRAEPSTPAKKEVAQVTKGKVTLRKKPLHKKFIDAFRPEDNRGFVEYTLLEVLVPSIKDAIADAGTSALHNALGTSGNRRSGGGGYTSYNRMSKPARSRRDDDDDRRKPARRESAPHSDVREAVFESRVEAEDVLDQLIEMVSRYDAATVRDLLSMIGERHEFTDEDWGWPDLRGSKIHRLGAQGYLLDLPRPVFLG